MAVNPPTLQTDDVALIHQAPTLAGLQFPAAPANQRPYRRFFRVDELCQDPPRVMRRALENVVAAIHQPHWRLVYLLSATPQGVQLYFGLVDLAINADAPHEAPIILESAFRGNFAGADIQVMPDGAWESQLAPLLQQSRHRGAICGVPSVDNDQEDADNSQGVERLVNSLLGETWQLLLVAMPLADEAIQRQVEGLFELATALHPLIRTSVQIGHSTGASETVTRSQGTSLSTAKTDGTSAGEAQNLSSSKTQNTGDNHSTTRTDGTNTGDSKAIGESRGQSTTESQEQVDKRAEALDRLIREQLVPRVQLGRSRGFFATAIYALAPHRAVFERLTRGLFAIFQDAESAFSPLRLVPLPDQIAPDALLTTFAVAKDTAVAPLHGMIHSQARQDGASGRYQVATLLNGVELAQWGALPSRELPGLSLRRNVEFALNLPRDRDEAPADPLGHLIQHGRVLRHNGVALSRALLRKHLFICGVTGSGKTTTCQRLLLSSGLPFLVIEPAKTEYRALYAAAPQVVYYTLGNESLSPFRFNPFELLPGESLSGHIDLLKATLVAAFPMEAAMPNLIAEAVLRSYQQKGWNVYQNENLEIDDPWDGHGEAWPVLSEMLTMLKQVIAEKNFGLDLQQKYEGSLIARLTDLTVGMKGRLLNTRQSIDFDALLDQSVVLEMEDLRDESDKALLMGLIVGRVAEAMKQRHQRDPQFQHLTLVEEAHRLLAKPEFGEGGNRRHGVNLFANLIAEVRKYGEGIIIADQIPNKLTDDVLKNTNTKIIHRLFAADDRQAMGDAVGLTDEQKGFLPHLQIGEALMYSGGWHGAVHLKVIPSSDTAAAPLPLEHLRRRGRQQQWLARHRLFPRLMAQGDWHQPDDLFDFLADAERLLGAVHRPLQQAALVKAPADKLRPWVRAHGRVSQLKATLKARWDARRAAPRDAPSTVPDHSMASFDGWLAPRLVACLEDRLPELPHAHALAWSQLVVLLGDDGESWNQNVVLARDFAHDFADLAQRPAL